MLAFFEVPCLFSGRELLTFCCFVIVALFLLAIGGRRPRGYAAGVLSCPLVFLVLAHVAVSAFGTQRPSYYDFVRTLAVCCGATTSIVCFLIAKLKVEQNKAEEHGPVE